MLRVVVTDALVFWFGGLCAALYCTAQIEELEKRDIAYIGVKDNLGFDPLAVRPLHESDACLLDSYPDASSPFVVLSFVVVWLPRIAVGASERGVLRGETQLRLPPLPKLKSSSSFDSSSSSSVSSSSSSSAAAAIDVDADAAVVFAATDAIFPAAIVTTEPNATASSSASSASVSASSSSSLSSSSSSPSVSYAYHYGIVHLMAVLLDDTSSSPSQSIRTATPLTAIRAASDASAVAWVPVDDLIRHGAAPTNTRTAAAASTRRSASLSSSFPYWPLSDGVPHVVARARQLLSLPLFNPSHYQRFLP